MPYAVGVNGDGGGGSRLLASALACGTCCTESGYVCGPTIRLTWFRSASIVTLCCRKANRTARPIAITTANRLGVVNLKAFRSCVTSTTDATDRAYSSARADLGRARGRSV